MVLLTVIYWLSETLKKKAVKTLKACDLYEIFILFIYILLIFLFFFLMSIRDKTLYVIVLWIKRKDRNDSLFAVK